MKKVRRYFLSPSRDTLHCEVWINGKLLLTFQRNLKIQFVVARGSESVDVTTFDLEFHSFLRVSHQYIVNPDSMSGVKIEEMFEMDCPII